MQDKILVIYVKRETREYDHFEVYPLNEKLTKEVLIKKVTEYNADSAKDLTAIVYGDPVLINFVSDVQASWQHKHLIENLKSICDDIKDSVDDLESWQERIEEVLETGNND